MSEQDAIQWLQTEKPVSKIEKAFHATFALAMISLVTVALTSCSDSPITEDGSIEKPIRVDGTPMYYQFPDGRVLPCWYVLTSRTCDFSHPVRVSK